VSRLARGSYDPAYRARGLLELLGEAAEHVKPARRRLADTKAVAKTLLSVLDSPQRGSVSGGSREPRARPV
jgi:hypothetical protein